MRGITLIFRQSSSCATGISVDLVHFCPGVHLFRSARYKFRARLICDSFRYLQIQYVSDERPHAQLRHT